jgi:hypothetical protein
MKNISCFCLLLCLPFCLEAQQTISFSGGINANTQWNYDTVYLMGDVTIQNNISLTIAAGTKVVSKGYFKIDVKGRLIAVGEPNKFINFTKLDTTGLRDTSSTRGGWNGLHFEGITADNDSSILRYCRIEYGKAVGITSLEKRGGGIFIDNCSKIRIQNCQIMDNIAKIGGGGIQIVNNASPIIIENLIKNNAATGELRISPEGGGISSLNNSSPIIQKNVIIENSASLVTYFQGFTASSGVGGGIHISSLTNKAPLISYNLIANNISINGALYESSLNTKATNNIIVNNFGGGVFLGHQLSVSTYANNTICNNNGGQGFYSSSGSVKIYNNIIRNNIAYGRDTVLTGLPLSYNCNIEYLPAYFRNSDFKNINAPTSFMRPTTIAGMDEKGYEADWRLKLGSPDIDAGTTSNGIIDVVGVKDFLGNPRIVGATIDIGAIEYAPLSTTTILNDLNVKIYPNPFTGQIWLEVDKPLIDAHYSIFSIDGNLVSQAILNQGTQLIQTEKFAIGTYIFIISDKNGKQVYNSKVVKH